MSHDPIRRRLTALAAAATVAAALAACSLPVDERVTPLDQSAFPETLTEATTTSSTTTTTVPESTVPVSTEPGQETTSTTAPVVPTEEVTVFYTRGVTDVMQPVQVVASPSPALVTDLITFLERPIGISESGLRSAVRPGLIDQLGPVDRGVATVVLDPDVLDRMSEPTRRQAIAQIVLTVTSFRTADVGAIGLVRFEVDGEGFSVYVPAFGGNSEPGEELAFTDFRSLIATTQTPTPVTPVTTTTTSTTSTTSTTVAASEPQNDEG